MGRTFGILVVLVGLWVLASLPTRGPDALETARSAPAASPPRAADAAPTPDTSGRAVLNAASLEASRDAQAATASARRKRTDERVHAARGRDLESEPDTSAIGIPQPVLVTARDVATVLSALAAAPVAPAVASPAVVAGPSAAPRAKATSSVTIPPPRIVTTALRDLAAAPLPTAAPAARAMSVRTPAPAQDALRSVPPTKATQRSPPEKPTMPDLKAAARATPAPEPKLPTPKLPTPSRTAHSGVRVAVARPEAARRSAPPRAQGVRVAYSYPPPAYLGRVYVAYPPQAFNMPSSGYFRRAQYQPETMWTVIRRSGM